MAVVFPASGSENHDQEFKYNYYWGLLFQDQDLGFLVWVHYRTGRRPNFWGMSSSIWNSHHLYLLSSSSVCSYLGLLYDLSHVMWTLSNCGRSCNRPIRKSIPAPLSGLTLWLRELMLLILFRVNVYQANFVMFYQSHWPVFHWFWNLDFYTDTLIWNNLFLEVLLGPLP